MKVIDQPVEGDTMENGLVCELNYNILQLNISEGEEKLNKRVIA